MAMPLRRKTRRALGLLLATVTLLAPALSALHAARARHVTCAEHGDLVDAQEPNVQVVHTDAGGPVALPSDGTAAVHQHDHCAVAAQARSAVALPENPTEAALPVEAAIVAPTSDVRAGAAIPLYLLAPKSSPPA